MEPAPLDRHFCVLCHSLALVQVQLYDFATVIFTCQRSNLFCSRCAGTDSFLFPPQTPQKPSFLQCLESHGYCALCASASSIPSIPLSAPIVSPAIKSFIFHSCTDRVLVSSLPVGGSARPGEQGLLGLSSSAGVLLGHRLLHPGEPKPWSRTSNLSSKSK